MPRWCYALVFDRLGSKPLVPRNFEVLEGQMGSHEHPSSYDLKDGIDSIGVNQKEQTLETGT